MKVRKRLRDLDSRVMGEHDLRQRRRFGLINVGIGLLLFGVAALLLLSR